MAVMAMSFFNEGTSVGNRVRSAVEDWGALIERVRLRHGLSVKAMAYRLGVSSKAYQKWVYEGGKPSIETAMRAAREFDEAWEWLQQQVGRTPDERLRLLDEFIARMQGRIV